MLIAASVAITAINDVDDVAIDYHRADSYRGAAIWLAIVGVVAVLYHGVTILFRILYCTVTIRQTYAGYSIAVSNHNNIATNIYKRRCVSISFSTYLQELLRID